MDYLQIQINDDYLADRFLGIIPMIIVMIPSFANLFVNAWATYLRCHKKEPFLVQSVVMAILTMTSTICLGNMYGLYGMTLGYCLLTVLVGTPWAYKIFKSKKQEWHGKSLVVNNYSDL